MDFADKLDFMDDDCDIEGFPLQMKGVNCMCEKGLAKILKNEILEKKTEFQFGIVLGKIIMAFYLHAITDEQYDLLIDMHNDRMNQFMYPEG